MRDPIEELACFQRVIDRGHSTFALIGVELIDQKKLQADRIDQAERRRQRGLRSRPVDDDAALGSQDAWDEFGVGSEIHFNDGVDTALAGDAPSRARQRFHACSR